MNGCPTVALEERKECKKSLIKQKHARKEDKYLAKKLNSIRYANFSLNDLREEELFYV